MTAPSHKGAARREIVDRIAVFIHSIMQSSGSQGAPNEVQSIILERLQEWDASHGREFKPLHAAVRYLREGKGFTFPEMEAVRNRRNAEREARRDERRCRLLLAKHEQLKREIPDTVHDLKDILKQAQVCDAYQMFLSVFLFKYMYIHLCCYTLSHAWTLSLGTFLQTSLMRNNK